MALTNVHSYLRSIPSSACVLIGFIYIIILSHSCSHFPTHTFTPSHPHRIRVTAYNGIVFGDSSTAVGTTQPIGNHSNQIMQLHAMKLQHACIHYTSSLLPWVDQTFDVYYCNSAMHTHAHTCKPHTHTYTTHTTHTHTQHTNTHTHTHTQGPPVLSQLLPRPQTSLAPQSMSAGSLQEGTWTSTTSSTN